MATYDVNPTRSELITLRKKIRLAESGHKLLKKKRDGLILEFFNVLKDAKKVRAEINQKYNVAYGRMIEAMALDGVAEIKNIVGIKEATGDLKQISDVISICPKDFLLLSGDDFTVYPTLAIGGHGVISVVANVAPKDMADLCDAYFAGDMKKASELHYKLLPLSGAMFYETNPIPVKTALSLMGKLSGEMRLPLFSMSEGNLNKLKKVMKDYRLIPQV